MIQPDLVFVAISHNPKAWYLKPYYDGTIL